MAKSVYLSVAFALCLTGCGARRSQFYRPLWVPNQVEYSSNDFEPTVTVSQPAYTRSSVPTVPNAKVSGSIATDTITSFDPTKVDDLFVAIRKAVAKMQASPEWAQMQITLSCNEDGKAFVNCARVTSTEREAYNVTATADKITLGIDVALTQYQERSGQSIVQPAPDRSKAERFLTSFEANLQAL